MHLMRLVATCSTPWRQGKTRSLQMRGLFPSRSPQSDVRNQQRAACTKDGALIVYATTSDRWRRLNLRLANCGVTAHFRVGSRPRARPCACARSKRAVLLRLLVPRHDGAAKGPQRARLRRQMTSSLRQVRDVLLARSRQQPRAGLVLGMVRRAGASRRCRRAVRGRAGGRGRGRGRASRLPWAGARRRRGFLTNFVMP